MKRKSHIQARLNLAGLFILAFALPSFLLNSCQKDAAPTGGSQRPNDPWVFRSVLDSMPRMLTVALHDDLWAAYHTETGSLYKAWKGSVNFDGAVYTTAHGPQPSSLGNGWFQNPYKEPWKIMRGKTEEPFTFQFRGHRFEEGKVWLNYELTLKDGARILVSEQPEYLTNGSKQTGFERIFTTSGVPDGVDVAFQTFFSSVAMENAIQTDGKWQVTNKQDRQFKNLRGIDLHGILTLKPNGKTRLAAFFTQKPMIENLNRVEGEEEAENLPLGLRLINRNDCKTCHNTFVATVGPSYQEVAGRYKSTDDNVAMLVAKVKNGGAGNWGQAAMTPHADMDENEISIMVKWIMSLDSLDEAKLASVPENKAAASAGAALSAATDVKEEDIFPGAVVKVYQYQKGLTKLADLKPFPKPVFEGIVPQLHATQQDFGELTDNFGIVAEGYLKIPKDNNYVFRLISDDGSSLHIGDKLIIDHDGLHGDEPRDGEIALKAGLHPFRIEYFEGGGGNTISFLWKSFDDAGGKFEIVPSSLLAHDKNKQPVSSNLAPFAQGAKIPGDASPLPGVHPSFDLTQARPDDFFPKVGGMDFLSDGRLVVSTWDAEGGVYVLSNVQSGDPKKMKAKKIAAGLAEPLGLKVVNDTIYILQKQELTKLIDHNGDDIIDEYYTLCNKWGVSTNFHEFAFGLVFKDGYFYGALATDILPGGAGAPTQPADRGKLFKISQKDGSMELIASGLRTPNGIGIGVDGEIFNADNQGDWLPSSKIVHIKPGAFYGSRAVDFAGTATKPVMQPVVWLPQDEVGNSPSTPLAINDGPYKGQMIHGEVTNGGIKRVFVEKVNGEYQGCVFHMSLGFEAGINRLAWGPDGALYAGGIGNPGNWSDMVTPDKKWYGLQRLKYNGKSTFEMLAVRAKSNGMEIELTEPLAEGFGWSPADYEVMQWRYVPTKEYGGPKVDETRLKVLSASVSQDRRKVFLELAGMKAGHVVYVHLPYWFESETGSELWATEGWYTLNALPNTAGQKLSPTAPPAPNTLSQAEQAAGWKLLFDGKSTAGWHSFGKKTTGKDWQVQDGAIFLNAAARNAEGWQAADGGDIVTDAEYENYELRLEWKIAPCGNSGVVYNIVEDPKYKYMWETGPEMQVLDNACHPDAQIEKHRAGELYDLIGTQYAAVKPAGQWNRARLVNNKGHVEHWLNGRKVAQVQMTGEEWTKLVAGSKFKEMPAFGKQIKGRIGLQDHGDKVWFRNIKLRQLK